MQSYNPLAAIQGGYGFGAQIDEDKARRTAGNALAGNDFTGARNVLSQAGMLGEAMDIQGYQDDRANYARNVGRQDKRDRWADEDRSLDNADREKAARVAEIRERGQWLGNATSSLMRVPPEQRQQAFEQYILPTLQAMGADAQTIQRLTAADKSDQALQAYLGTLGQQIAEAEGVVLNDGDILLNKRTGAKLGENPREPEYIQRDPEKDLIEIGGGPSGPMAGPEGFSSEEIIGRVEQIVPGLRVNGRARTPGRNAEVDGVADSYHLTDQAVDYAIPQGMTADQLAGRLRAGLGASYDVVPEGDHVHVEPAPGVVRGGPRVVERGQPKPREGYRPATAAELEAYGLAPGTPAQVGPNGQLSTVGSAAANPNAIATNMRREFEGRPEVKDFNIVRSGYEQVREIAGKENATAADDIALIFSYMKMLDPGSVVREGEYATAQNATGVPEQILNSYNRLLTGERLNPRQRRQFADTAATVFQARERRYQELEQQFRQQAITAGADPDRVVPGVAAAPPPASGPARPAAPGRSGARRPLSEIIR